MGGGLVRAVRTALLFFGFGYYIYNTAKSKGWFKVRAKYYIFTDSAKGLRIGDPIEFRGEIGGQHHRH